MWQTKAALGGMRFQLLPDGADQSEWLVATENYVISRSQGAHCLSCPHKEPTLGFPQ